MNTKHHTRLLREEAQRRGFTDAQMREFIDAGLKWWEENGEKPTKMSGWVMADNQFSSDR